MAEREEDKRVGKSLPNPSLRATAAIQAALAYVGARLQDPLSVAQVAQHVAMSEAHFQRVFHELVGETIGQFVTRKRLETAALRLAYEPETPITVIALSSGYSSSSNFGKAFAGYFGLNPSQLRNPTPDLSPRLGKLLSHWGKLVQAAELYTLPRELDDGALRREVAYWDARVRFETTHGLSLACLASKEGYDFEAVQQTWTELIRLGRQLGICDAEVDAWGITHDSPYLTAPERCRYYAGIPCAAALRLPLPLFPFEIEPGRYAVFHYVGTVLGLSEAYRSIYSCWFKTSSVAPEDFMPLERYVTNEPKGDQLELEIWFRVRSKA